MGPNRSQYHNGSSTFKISYEPEAFHMASSIQHLVSNTVASMDTSTDDSTSMETPTEDTTPMGTPTAAASPMASATEDTTPMETPTAAGTPTEDTTPMDTSTVSKAEQVLLVSDTQMPTGKGEASDATRDTTTASVSRDHEKVDLDEEANGVIEQAAVARHTNVEWQLQEAHRMNQMLLLEVRKLQVGTQSTYTSRLLTYTHAKWLEAKERFVELGRHRHIVAVCSYGNWLWGFVLDNTTFLVKAMRSQLIAFLKLLTKAPTSAASFIHVKWLQLDGMLRNFHAELAQAISYILSMLQDSGIDSLSVLTMCGMASLALKAAKVAFEVLQFLVYFVLNACGYGCLHIKVAFIYNGLPATINSTDQTDRTNSTNSTGTDTLLQQATTS